MSMQGLYYDRQGNQLVLDLADPNDMKRFLELWEDDSMRVALDQVDGISISTVHLVVNHNWSVGPPLIFETMVFGYPQGVDNAVEYQWRYSTLEQAQSGHTAVVEAVKNRTLTRDFYPLEEE